MSNEQQIDYWNGKTGSIWVAAQERMDRMLEPLTKPLLSAAAASSGERIIDVGCGCGDTSLQLANNGAQVWGVDISEPMLNRANERAKAQNLTASRFTVTDAADEIFSAEHDLVFSRFGVMFFSDSVGAFRNLHSSLNSTGRLCFLCWQPPGQNPWMATAGAAIKEFMPVPETPPDPRAPGPFAFADTNYLHSTLDAAGFKNIAITPVTTNLHIADNLDDAMEFQVQIGPLARAIAELEGETRDQALTAARAALNRHLTPSGINLGAACWLAQATAN